MDFNMTLIGQSAAFLLFAWFCMKFVWPPIMNAIEARQSEIAEGLAASEEAQTRLANAKSEADKLIAEARDQARAIVDQASSRANAIIDEGRSEGAAQRQREVEDAHSQIELEKNRVREELRSQVAAIALAGAERVLAREIDARTHRQLLDELASGL